MRSLFEFGRVSSRLNPTLPPEAITTTIDELDRDRSAVSLEAANRMLYRLWMEGISVSLAGTDNSTPLTG